VKLVSSSALTGTVYYLRIIFVTLASTDLICCLRGQKGEFVIIILMFFYTTNKIFSS
jgi:hypothetical protein